MREQHFVERLALRDRFSVLAREVLALSKKRIKKDKSIPYHYFEQKRYMREHHGINVSSPMSKARERLAKDAIKQQKAVGKRTNHKWNKLYDWKTK